MLLERGVEVHDLFHRGVEAGQEHVAYHQDAERVVLVLEALDVAVLVFFAQVVLGQPLLVVVGRRHDQHRLGAVEAVEGLLVDDGGVAADGDDLGLEAVVRLPE